MHVARLGLDAGGSAYVLVLRELAGERVLPIWIGQPEAEAIVLELNQVHRERPMTHDLCKSLILGLGGRVRRVAITREVEGTYYAELLLEAPAGPVRVDARPSDGIAIALRVAAPIFAADDLLVAPPDGGEESSPPGPTGPSAPRGELTPEQLKAHLERLRPEDFGKFRP